MSVYNKQRGTATIALSGTSADVSHTIAGNLGPVVVSVPALTGTGTVTFRGTEELGGTIYPSTTITESSVTRIDPSGTPTPFEGTLDIRVEETSGTQDAAADITYNIYYEEKQG